MDRITLFAGHYGSGKTNLALAWARHLRECGEASGRKVVVADLDIVNPYFRTKDSAAELAAEGIELVVSQYANSNVDFPALPKELYAVFTESAPLVVADIGGDDRGALALGRYVPDILKSNDYEYLAVINASRPLTSTATEAVEVLREIEASSSGLRFTGIVNNTNLGPETTAETVLGSLDYADEVSRLMNIPVRFTACMDSLAGELKGRVKRLFPIAIQRLYYQYDHP